MSFLFMKPFEQWECKTIRLSVYVLGKYSKIVDGTPDILMSTLTCRRIISIYKYLTKPQ